MRNWRRLRSDLVLFLVCLLGGVPARGAELVLVERLVLQSDGRYEEAVHVAFHPNGKSFGCLWGTRGRLASYPRLIEYDRVTGRESRRRDALTAPMLNRMVGVTYLPDTDLLATLRAAGDREGPFFRGGVFFFRENDDLVGGWPSVREKERFGKPLVGVVSAGPSEVVVVTDRAEVCFIEFPSGYLRAHHRLAVPQIRTEARLEGAKRSIARLSPSGRRVLCVRWGARECGIFDAHTHALVSRTNAAGLWDAMFLDDEAVLFLWKRQEPRRLEWEVVTATGSRGPIGLTAINVRDAAIVNPEVIVLVPGESTDEPRPGFTLHATDDGRKVGGRTGFQVVDRWSSPDGRWLAVATTDRKLRLWELEGGPKPP